MKIILFLCLLIFSYLREVGGLLAADDWCLNPPGVEFYVPCDWPNGRCTRNADGSDGGWVSYGAKVQTRRQSRRYFWKKRNVPTIEKYTQICQEATIEGEETAIRGRARIMGKAHVIDGAEIFDGVTILGDAWVVGRGTKVRDKAIVSGNSIVASGAILEGYAWVQGWSEIYSGRHDSGIIKDIIIPMMVSILQDLENGYECIGRGVTHACEEYKCLARDIIKSIEKIRTPLQGCSICTGRISEDFITPNCELNKHHFCTSCFFKLQSANCLDCPMCRNSKYDHHYFQFRPLKKDKN